MTLRIGLVGFGARARLSRLVAEVDRDARVVAIAEPTARGKADAAAIHPDARVVDDVSELLDLDLDAVMVFTPDDRHAEPARLALERGLAVFVEKPLATRTEDADQVLAAAARSGSRLYVGHNMRHMPVIRQMRELVASGRIGEVKAVWCRHFVGNGGDYYFKDWHADRSRSNGLLLQKGAHDLDVIHWIAGASTARVAAMGALAVYGGIADRRDRSGERMGDWFSTDNWPPASQTGLHPVIDVEDLSQVTMQLRNGVLATYQQCHFTPDYWRNYTVIGTEGRLENLGDDSGSTIGLWTRRHGGQAAPDEEVLVESAEGSHGGADPLLVAEFLRFAREGGATETSPVAARDAVAAGDYATRSIRSGGGALDVPALDDDVAGYFDAEQPASARGR